MELGKVVDFQYTNKNINIGGLTRHKAVKIIFTPVYNTIWINLIDVIHIALKKEIW